MRRKLGRRPLNRLSPLDEIRELGMAKPAAHVTEAELAVLEVLWNKGPNSAREITERLYPRGKPADVATVQKLLQRLERKKFVCRDRSERVHQFSAAIPRDEFAGQQL